MDEQAALEAWVAATLNDATLLSYCMGGVHFRYVTDAAGQPIAGYPEYVTPTVVWDVRPGQDNNAAGGRAFVEVMLSVKVIAEDIPNEVDLPNIASAITQIETLMEAARVVQGNVRIRTISERRIDMPELVSGGRYLRHQGREWRVVLSPAT